ncbi:epoxide hydrolase [Dactylosporangium sp. AC04546]|uniref:epoxide hydrolase family protein n=1 Tax=Dactylosporangium sp. AC04546 TaxID=2862460 RepID=UPI001EDD0687|nr:epoxide hydrolase family protein [Dactylosporangium sp. AC04546]WVK86424.1 epoxide hydrolase [Dactylosporangium sp. AC04546]
MNATDTVTPFRIEIPEPTLIDLRERLERTRWADAVADDWARGTAPSALRELVARWADGYDWRATEARLNRLAHYTYNGLHFVRVGTRGKQPLLLIHGWPDSFLRFEKILPLLADDFDLIVPSIPGFGFSQRPDTAGSSAPQAADRFNELMDHLGLTRYAVHGGDCGAQIGELIALRHPEHVAALHITDLPFWHSFGLDPATLSIEEQAYLGKAQEWARREGAYAQQQTTKPQTLGYGLNDSPAGLAAWLLEKYQSWTDGGYDKALGADAVLDNLTLYWVTQTAVSSVRFYFETAAALGEILGRGPVTAPTAIAALPGDPTKPLRSLAERSLPIRRWTELPAGGHFGAWEQPEALALDLHAFLSLHA